jgi:translation elongation factor IF5A
MADDSESGLIQPCSAGDLKKGVVGMIGGRPCKVLEVSVSKTGKHGHAKCSITAQCVFTGKKVTDVQPSHAHMYIANITKKEYQLIAIDEKNNDATLLNDQGEECHVTLEGESAADMVANADLTGDKDVYVTVSSGPMGKDGGKPDEVTKIEQISGWKYQQASS